MSKHEVPRIETLSTANIKLIATNKFWWCLVFLLVVFSVLPSSAKAATLYFSPLSGAYQTGRNFTVNINVQSPAALNAASGIITFPTNRLEAISVSKTGSIFNLWVQEPSFSNSAGTVNFEGIVLNPGFTGIGKTIGITFRVKSTGTANLAFSSGSVLANDGLGTNILSDLGTAKFTLSQGPAVVPETVLTPTTGLPPLPIIKHYVKDAGGEWVFSHDSEKGKDWINNRSNKLTWEIPVGVTGVSILLNNKPTSSPGSKSDGYFDDKIYENLTEDIHYLHIRYINASGAGPILHYKFGVDATPPESFKIGLPDGEVTANPAPRILFETTDKTSGIDRYEIKIDGGDWIDAEKLKVASYVLPKLSPGGHKILVRAYDKAGNYTDAQVSIVVSAIAAPEITYYPENIISPGEKLVIKGGALPKAAIEVHMIKRDKEPIIFNSQADEKGNWEAIYENIIPSGAYEVWAKQILENGAESLQSQIVIIGVNSWFWRAWQWVKNVGGAITVSLILLAIILVAAYYFWHHFKMWRIKLRREVREAEKAVSSGFKKIKREIKSGKKAPKILSDVSDVEKNIKKEIEDIEKK